MLIGQATSIVHTLRNCQGLLNDVAWPLLTRRPEMGGTGLRMTHTQAGLHELLGVTVRVMVALFT